MFFITVSNGLLTQEHYERMGASVWQFMWCIDKITRVDSDGWGWVLGGKPINLDDIPFGHRITTSRNLGALEKEGYIRLVHTPNGIIVKVAKAKKRFSTIVKPGLARTLNPVSKNAKPNKTVSVDSIRTTTHGPGLEGGDLETNTEPMNPELVYEEVDDAGLPTRKIPGLRKPVSQRRAVFDQEAEVKDLLNSPVLVHKIVGVYIRRKQFRFRNYDQWYAAIAREIHAAKPLKGYSHDEIVRTMTYCAEKWPDAWTLETVGKRIYEVIKNQ